MANPPWPTCEIQWIDCECRSTPDKNESVAVVEHAGKRFYICSDHFDTLVAGGHSHHDKNCKHRSYWTGWKLVRMLP